MQHLTTLHNLITHLEHEATAPTTSSITTNPHRQARSRIPGRADLFYILTDEVTPTLVSWCQALAVEAGLTPPHSAPTSRLTAWLLANQPHLPAEQLERLDVVLADLVDTLRPYATGQTVGARWYTVEQLAQLMGCSREAMRKRLSRMRPAPEMFRVRGRVLYRMRLP